MEEEVRSYSASLYLEVAARNLEALSFYRTLGYDCLNTVTLRKDFHPEDFQIVQTERIAGHDLTIKRYKEKEE